MGQKTHPLGFRLGITQKHRSNWYTPLNKYAILVEEDTKIRNYFKNLIKSASIADITINRNGLNNQVQLIIETGRPGILVGYKNIGIKNLISNIKKLISYPCQILINIKEVEQVNLNANLVADLLVKKLEERITFKRAIKEALQSSYITNISGIKIQVSGRLNGTEIARTEWVREGRVPLQTLRANINYSIKEARTIYGTLGIKVWLFKYEILK